MTILIILMTMLIIRESFFLGFLWTVVESARFPVRFTGYTAYLTLETLFILVVQYKFPDMVLL